MELDDFPEAEIPQSGEPTVKRFVSGKDVFGGLLEILCWPRKEITHGGGSQIPNRDIQSLGGLCQLALGVAGEVK